jgi:hypothetical protein
MWGSTSVTIADITTEVTSIERKPFSHWLGEVQENHMNAPQHSEHGGEHIAIHGAPGGLAISEAGYTLDIGSKTFEAGREERFEFRILNQSGRAVRRDFDEQHEEPMHLIIVRRDMLHYQHLHPSLGTDGTWSIDFALPEPGVYRAFADFSVGGRALTLGADLTVPGNLEFTHLPDPSGGAHTEDYEVTFDTRVLSAGTESSLTFHIRASGQDVEQLEPYLGALGHLVALREGDLAFLHVHPTGGAGSQIKFHAVFPSLGRYRMFLQFSHKGRVRTAAFTIEISP